jgi:hypothetical protein
MSSRPIVDCFHTTVFKFTCRTEFLFSVSLNAGKIQFACLKVVGLEAVENSEVSSS